MCFIKEKRNQLKKLLLFIILIMCFYSLNIRYVAGENSEEEVQTVVDESRDIQFTKEYEDDISISLIPVGLDTVDPNTRLESITEIRDNKLFIQSEEAVGVSELLSGNKYLRIDYQVRIPRGYDEIVSDKDTQYDLEKVTFEKRKDKVEPFWRISNSSESWGVGSLGTRNIEIGDTIDKLMSKRLGGLEGCNIIYSRKDGLLKGYIKIYTLNRKYKVSTLKLQDLNLGNDICEEIGEKFGKQEESNSILEMIASYNLNLNIPMELKDDVNIDKIREPLKLQVTLPLRFHKKVLSYAK